MSFYTPEGFPQLFFHGCPNNLSTWLLLLLYICWLSCGLSAQKIQKKYTPNRLSLICCIFFWFFLRPYTANVSGFTILAYTEHCLGRLFCIIWPPGGVWVPQMALGAAQAKRKSYTRLLVHSAEKTLSIEQVPWGNPAANLESALASPGVLCRPWHYSPSISYFVSTELSFSWLSV